MSQINYANELSQAVHGKTGCLKLVHANNCGKIHLGLSKGNMVLNGKHDVPVKALPPPWQVDVPAFIILSQCMILLDSVKWYMGCPREGATQTKASRCT